MCFYLNFLIIYDILKSFLRTYESPESSKTSRGSYNNTILFFKSLVFLILHILHIIDYHQGNLEGQGVIKLTDIKTGTLL